MKRAICSRQTSNIKDKMQREALSLKGKSGRWNLGSAGGRWNLGSAGRKEKHQNINTWWKYFSLFLITLKINNCLQIANDDYQVYN